MSAAIFFFSCYQYVIMAFVFSVGEPFRQPGNIILQFYHPKISENQPINTEFLERLIKNEPKITKCFLVTKNILFLASLVGLIIITSLIVLTDNLWLQEKFEVVFIFEQQILQIPPVHQNLFRLM